MPAEVTPVPSGRGRAVAIAVSVVLLVAFLSGVTWLALRPKSQQPARRPPRIEPAQETSVATMPVLPGVPTSDSAVSTGTRPAADPGARAFTRAARTAFRLGSTLYVANEDGTSPTPVVRVAEGAYALSPDGLTLAVTHADSLTLYDTATGSPVQAGPALDTRPVWLPDSSALLYLRRSPGAHAGATEVWRVRRDGTRPKKLHRGAAPGVSPDGRTIAIVGTQSDATSRGGVVFVSVDDGAFGTVRVAAGVPTAVAVCGSRLYVGVATSGASAKLLSMKLDGGEPTPLHDGVDADAPATWGELAVCPGGERLAAAATGDDEYSRLRVFTLATGAEVRLNSRRDCYFHGWNAAGDRLILIEGNAYQGEPTTLVSVGCDGDGRRTLVTGAE